MSKILEIRGRKILDSREQETVEVQVKTDDGFMAIDSVPSGTSMGTREAALVATDKAIQNINTIIAPKLVGHDIADQIGIDRAMLELDGTPNKSKLGANAILGVSLAASRAAAFSKKMPLYWHINKIYNSVYNESLEPQLPLPMMVIIEGGKHGLGNKLGIQEFLVISSLANGIRVWESTKGALLEKNIPDTLGLEGGFAPKIDNNEVALDILTDAINRTGLEKDKDYKLALDMAGSNYSMPLEEVLALIQKYGIYSVEDPFGENDWQSFASLNSSLVNSGSEYLIIGDDLFTTNKLYLEQGIKLNAANGIIIKPNQIGTLSETLEVVHTAKKAGMKCIVSHRSGETMDAYIADLAVGLSADFLKSGAPGPSERLAKYHRLEEIGKEL